MKISDLKNYTVVGANNTIFPELSEKKTKQSRDFLQKTGDVVNSIFPGKQVGESIGTLAGLGIEKAKGLLGGQDNSETFDLSSPSIMQVAGDIGAGALTVAGFKGVGAGGTIAKRLATNTAMGAGFGGTQSIARGESAENVIKSTAIGAGTGLAIGGLSIGAEKLLGQIKALPERLVRSATNQSKKELLAGKDISKYIIENKKIGSANKLIDDSQVMIEKANNIINNNLKSVSITTSKITNKSLLSDITKKVNLGGGSITNAEVKDILHRLAPQSKGLLSKPSMSLVNANKLRQSLDKTLGDKGFLTAELPFNKEVLRSFANTLREQVKTKAPEGTRAAFNTLSKEITLRDTLIKKITQESRNQIISFSDLFGAIPGALVGGIPGAIAGAAAKRAVQSTPVLTGTAVGIDVLSRKLEPILQQLEPAARTLVQKALAELLSEESQKEPE